MPSGGRAMMGAVIGNPRRLIFMTFVVALVVAGALVAVGLMVPSSPIDIWSEIAKAASSSLQSRS